MVVWLFIVLVCAAVAAFVRHQHSLRHRAYLMREAVRNRDWSFRLTTRGLTSGERAMQEALNDLGEQVRLALNQGQVESWERLTRVLTHEIMNSTAPVASISQSLLHRPEVEGSPLEDGIRTIHTTAVRLTSFVSSYRELALLKTPSPEVVDLEAFFDQFGHLYPTLAWDTAGIGTAAVCTDPVLLQQIVVNLVKNALEAGARRMLVQCVDAGKGRLQIAVSNDGDPIPADCRNSIFVPFFTTKPQGSGIGLSLSRQHLVRQGGDLTLDEQPQPGYNATFRITL